MIWLIALSHPHLERFRDESSKLSNLALAANVLHRPGHRTRLRKLAKPLRHISTVMPSLPCETGMRNAPLGPQGTGDGGLRSHATR